MSRAYADLAFTPTVRSLQTQAGSRHAYAALDRTNDRRDALGEAEAAFIEARDGFYQASVGETGWPYVQFRGGPAGFLRVLDAKTLGYVDYRGNRQYISTGNFQGNDRVSLFLMDYPNRRRLKLLGRVRLLAPGDAPEVWAQLPAPPEGTAVERAVLITVEAFDWNCPQHITPRFTEAEVQHAVAPLLAEMDTLRAEITQLRAAQAGLNA
ncbi:pyridoxamine 5'-phosphate oxidase family protein [Inhella gelatinilytica]|uniref:Pyridoxamine 5'-phosphate oxidase family protein n=1 Tax=Inhella gelatinilytica TaxID=2795030 RepID=A0A931J0B7_9BURK|nr:pyridoxamine 5'-phosphate oxidase family protein [Inhella gelatinilytica]MBH9553193.1 pyridoxamine 5'-phosphate oxidase family protein [Inhella gelatinilytica]